MELAFPEREVIGFKRHEGIFPAAFIGHCFTAKLVVHGVGVADEADFIVFPIVVIYGNAGAYLVEDILQYLTIAMDQLAGDGLIEFF